MTQSKNKKLNAWVKKCAELCKPDKIVWIDGSEKQKHQLEKEACKAGEIIELNQKQMPGCFYHRTALNDVARTEKLTLICTSKKRDAGPTNHWMLPKDAYAKARAIFKGSMKGHTMYVIPFSMGPVGSPFSKIGVELTDSIYVVLNMLIMTRAGQEVLDVLGKDGEFTKCLHGKADLDIDKRWIMHFPEDNTIWSVGSGYGGNVLLGKKCLSLRIGSYLAAKENWMAEHMLIMGIEDPYGNIEYIAAAFPSACGKTNLAMLVPPDGLKAKGYRIWTVGDDIAWMKMDVDGRLWAVNPENGFFGVAPGTNSKTNPNAVASVKKNSIFTNVLLKKDGTVWWEGGDGDIPEEGTDWKGNAWRPGMLDEEGKMVHGAHPNARFTAPLKQCPTVSNRVNQPHGVPISAIIFGGRRARLAPLVFESLNWQHGVYVGATMASERTAAQYGKQGEIRRDPMAMLPFCGYNMGDYFKHWLKMGKKMKQAPKIFHVNWFKQDKDGNFIWPGFGDNLRVLEWVIARCKGKGKAKKTPIGYVPTADALDLTGLDIDPKTMQQLLHVDKKEWKKELENIGEFFKKFGKDLPKEIKEEYNALQRRIEQ
ncbi:MAG: phosphoenolpyruvate carboxykinase (GTP) [Candidatus Margulisbacteria bacterium]|nr:phosphoenolpyruvate carboxykinase (GTP) [Candidatus Margulisiibacteriota bacterium]MBU1021305.1 phosphoenolpyruvate carboxykinase (GTP) [Candidatus Margulisiibacteriota bacterium]MBU1729206.1 phosphoenolpyruvate carboxykinase (GTP) [Candidatus Margulisiibacteriota bacterium]MBU1954879.1 phosphoenolpyruvate carboxykinase (GTP) [Candidatus Margulisiibacteriota bacterium]